MTIADLSPRPLVLSQLVAPRLPAWARTSALVVGAASLVGVAAQVSVPVPGTPVPFTGQTFAVLLVGAVLGWQQAAASMVLYLLAGGLGVPWFTSGGSGFGAPTLGYVVGFVLAATVVGWLAERGADRTVVGTVATMVLGTALIYAVGVPWLAHEVHVSGLAAWRLGARPFLVIDGLKVALAAGLLPGAWAVVRRVRG